MAEIFYLAKGDTHTALRATLKDETGAAVDLTGATVTLLMRKGSTPKIQTAVNVLDQSVESNRGKVVYQFSDADVDKAGVYDKSTFRAVFADGRADTFPRGKTKYFTIDIQ